MQIDINTTTYSTKQRILAFFMAFMIFSLTFSQGLENLGVGLIVHAEDESSSVVTSSKTANIANSHAITGGTTKYTGKILDYSNSTTELFDYISDQELDSDSGTTITNSEASGYEDQHTYFNNAISEGSNYLVSAASNNITIAFSDSTVSSTDAVYVHMWDSTLNTSSNYETKWPGIKMKYDESISKFVYTFRPSILGFTPDKLKFNSGDGDWQTENITMSTALEAGNTYSFTKDSHGDVKIVINIIGGNTASENYPLQLYLWDDAHNNGWPSSGPPAMTYITGTQFSYSTSDATWKNLIVYKLTSSNHKWQTKDKKDQSFTMGHTYTYSINPTTRDWSDSLPGKATATVSGPTDSGNTIVKTSGSRDLYSQYKTPLYFGCFYNPNFTPGYKADYKNFYWQPNMSLRTNSSASVQNLVDTTLTDGKLYQDGKELPYFSKTLAESAKYKYNYNGTDRNMIKYYDDDLHFPFYEIRTDATNVVGHENGDTGKARFYQFNAKETYVYFDGTDFTETSTPIGSQLTASSTRTIGFYPFNDENDSTKNNLAFGAKFTVDFKLGEDGKIETLDSNDNGTGKFVNTVFEFEGDDDVWVFIDDNLVLDLGGVHKDTRGYIDFAEREAVANSAVIYNTSTGDNLNATASAQTKQNTNVGESDETFAFTNLLKDAAYYQEHHQYNPETKHTLTLFYMERGMYESDLLVRFNFETVSNKNTLKVREVTDFTDVNDGLKAVTRRAADSDVFQYTLSNKGTVNSDTRSSGIQTPTYDYYQRKHTDTDVANSPTAMLTGQTMPYELKNDTENIYLNTKVNNDGYWEVGSSIYPLAAWVWEDGTDGHLVFGKETNTAHVFKFSASGCNRVIFFRLNTMPEETMEELDGTTTWNDFIGYKNKQAGTYSFTDLGCTFKMTDWNNIYLSNDATVQIEDYNPTYTTNNYTPGATLADPPVYVNVGNTNYLWTDEYADVTTAPNGQPSDGIDGMTATTDSNGVLPLMYGTSDKESSAFFKYQFKTDSDMKVIQNNALQKPVDSATALIADDNLTAASRNVNDYYTTTVTLDDKYNSISDDVASTSGEGVDDYTTEYGYRNSTATQTAYPKEPVEITETFTNRVITHEITVAKQVKKTNPKDNTVTNQDDETNDLFKMKLTLTDVFGQSGVNVASNGYGDIVVSGAYLQNGSGRTTTLNSDGTFYMKAGANNQVTISGIPHNTKYTLVEQSVNGYQLVRYDNVNASTTAQTIDMGKTTTVVNTRKITPVTVTKQDESGNGLPGAEMKLYFKESETPTRNTMNDPTVTPTRTVEVTVPTEPTAPAVEPITVTQQGDKIISYKYTYSEQAVPSAEATNWILPRNDSDYIYFRDYNSGSPGEWDKTSFGGSSKTAWRSSFFANKSSGTHHQDEELGFSDESEWVAAQFTKDDGSGFVQYAVWERFVDKYANQNTIVWKIQPPDGYNKVRFCLYKGGTCIRTTEQFTFELGKIYHKTNWGGKWGSNDGQNCYFNVPVTAEETNNDKYWAPETTPRPASNVPEYDHRTENNGTMLQAQAYEPTEQKVIFHCNSANVWHNIHIMFFDENGDSINNQPFPGYMMEPYAYAGSDYRMSDGYLTYELTIPKGAYSFQVNNGVESDDYAFKTEKKVLYTDHNSDPNVTITKNHGNYFCLGSYETGSNYHTSSNGSNHTDNLKNDSQEYTLTDWTNINDTKTATYTTNAVESDYDYIYFEAPNSWGSNIYAYFYGGGNLRDDNWQRACYSSWPGITPDGTVFTAKGANGTPVTATGTSDVYTTTGSNPDNSFADNNSDTTVYKFKVPLGDRKNYSKVIFNNGLQCELPQDVSAHETGVITYSKGYLYKANGSAYKHYENKPTNQFEQRGDKLYIKNTAGWDDIHVQFYTADDTRILQGGQGYLMEYSGKLAASGTNSTDYFCIPIPTGAEKFSLSNGVSTYNSNTGTSNTTTTAKMAIPKLNTSLDTSNVTTADETNGDVVYELTASNTLALLSPTVTVEKIETTPEPSQSTYTPTKTSPRGDYIYIRDTANVLSGIPTIQFYQAQTGGSAISTQIQVLELQENPTGTEWYSAGIPTNANYFTINGGSTRYIIYPKNNTNYEQVNTTKGDMYYDTVTNQTLDLVWPTFETDEEDLSDEDYDISTSSLGQRGDNLYVVNAAQLTSGFVTFYDANGLPIVNATGSSQISLKYLGEITAPAAGKSPVDGKTSADPNERGHWYRVAIPTNAKAFSVTYTVNNGTPTTTSRADIFEKKEKLNRYVTDYTLGDMQYRLDGTATQLLYPIFTEEDNNTLSVGNGQTISSNGDAQKVDAGAIEGYVDKAAATASTVSSVPPPQPVLYETESNDVTYASGSLYYDYVRFDVGTLGWTNVQAHFENSSSDPKWSWDSSGSSTHASDMTPLGNGVFMKEIPKKDSDNSYYRYVIFHKKGDEDQTIRIDLNQCDHGRGYKFVYYSTNDNGSKRGVNISEPSGASITKNPTTVTTTNAVYFMHPNNSVDSKHQFQDQTKAYVKYEGSTSFTIIENSGTKSQNETYLVSNPSTNVGSQTTNSGNLWVYKTDSSKAIKAIYFKDSDNNDTETIHLTTDSTTTDFTSHAFIVGSKNDSTHDNSLSGHSYSSSSVPIWDVGAVGTKTTTYTYSGCTAVSAGDSLVYQPEDRYGMISEVNGDDGVVGTDDINNFIYLDIDSSIADPYIMFYSSADAASNTKIGNTDNLSGTGISLKKAKIAGDTSTTDNTNICKIRLPKDAKSFKISDGDTTLSSTAIQLEATDYTVKSADGTPYTVPAQNPEPYVTFANYRHAGTTFAIIKSSNDGILDNSKYTGGIKLRSGSTRPTSAITDPLNPRTDNDYIFFTDSSNQFGTTVYAYYYGGEDGEYTAWPGIKASTSDLAPLVYTNSDNKKVYMFQLPNVGDGKYPYVIFNNGQTGANRKETQAIRIMNDAETAYTAGGKNYSYVTDDPEQYGTYDSTASHVVNAYATTPATKAPSPTEYYSSNKYIYIINNGTNKLAGNANRDSFDDLHVVFYDKDGKVVGNGSPGYKPDKLITTGATPAAVTYIFEGGTTPYNVYRISVPGSAESFQLNNGGSDHQIDRMSEIKPVTSNGLYSFVESATEAVDYIQEDNTTGNINEKHFLLDLVNKIKDTETDEEDPPASRTYDVHLATVETGTGGTIKKITWLKDDANNIDTNYLFHQSNDVNNYNVTRVNVLKMGDYYWVESSPPEGYEIQTTPVTFTVDGTDSMSSSTVIDPPLPTGNLTVKKTVDGEGIPQEDQNQVFTFTVNLTLPDGVNWSDYASGVSTSVSPEPVNPETVPNISGSAATPPVYTIELKNGQSVTISGLPVGTTYQVTETNPNPNDSKWAQSYTIYPTGDSNTHTFTDAGATPASGNTITKTARTVEFKNTYQSLETGNLVVNKSIVNSINNFTPTEFDIDVTLEPPTSPAMTISKFKEFIEPPYTELPNSTSPTSIKKTLHITTSSGTGSAEISGLPVGTTYTISETAASKAKTSSVAYEVNSVTGDNGTIVSTENGNIATVTNTYPDIGSLKLIKAYEHGSEETSGSETYFLYQVVLTKPDSLSSWTDYNYNNTVANHVISLSTGSFVDEDGADKTGDTTAVGTVNENTYTFYVKVKNGNDVTVNYIPEGTTYTVTEMKPLTNGTWGAVTGQADTWKDNSTNVIWKKVGELYGNTTESQHYITNNDTLNTYTATNAKLGKLTVSKEVIGSLNSVNNIEFTIHVILTSPNANTDIKDYLTETYLKGLDHVVANTVQYHAKDTNNYPKSQWEFNVRLKNQESINILGIPYSTDYEVKETNTRGANVSYYVNNIIEGSETIPDNKADGTIGSANAVKVKNSYTSFGSLKLTKKLEGDYAAKGVVPYSSEEDAPTPTKFQFEVVLIPPTGITPSELKALIQDNANDGGEWEIIKESDALNFLHDKKLKRIFKLAGNDTAGITISNLLKYTEYTVTEIALPGDNCAFQVQLGSTNSPTNGYTANDSIVDYSQDHTVEITNIYPGSLTLKKELVNPPFNVTNNTPFTFKVNIKKGTTTFHVMVGDTDQEITNGNATFDVSVSKNAPVTITNIPIGATYTVTEDRTAMTPTGTGSSITGEVTIPESPETETAEHLAARKVSKDNYTKTETITNTYPHINKSITLYKQDASNNHAAMKDVVFYLLKLKDTTDINNDAVKAAFASNNIHSVVPAYAEVVTNVGTSISKTVGGESVTYNNAFETNENGEFTVTEPNNTPWQEGESYFFYEVYTPTITVGETYINYIIDNSINDNNVITILNTQDQYTVVRENRRDTSTGVDVNKVDKDKNPLADATIDLWYKEVIIPSAFEPNSMFMPPTRKTANTVDSSLTAPLAETNTSQPTPPTYEYDYVNEEVPASVDNDWILPRSDNDYIYFRDFNIGDTYSGDTGAFNSDDSRRWIDTTLGPNSHSQNQELIYDTSLWLKAKFTAAGKPELNYSVWERFVDKYKYDVDTYETVVWKIQPPDGYTNVEFILCRGEEHLRNTQSIKYVLGNIYTKTNKGIYDGGQYGYPVKGEHWSTNWNGTGNALSDKRMTYSTFYKNNGDPTDNAGANQQAYVYSNTQNTNSNQQAPKQTERYVPTEQKIVFHCNSDLVWHNIHIEFFKETGTDTYTPVGQGEPGYLMEPYAYAPANYRVYGYLTYELTIPEGATHFRVNNGINHGSGYTDSNTYDFGFYSEITPLKHIEGRKNYGNYFMIKSEYQNMQTQPIKMDEWKNYTSTGDVWTATYNSLDITSDYDYIYFAAPSSWGTHVYAFFYGGGDLRKHNSQRACYSVWPGVAPVGSDYVETNIDGDNTTYHSDTYQYSYENILYDGGTSNITNPESTFNYTKDGQTYNVYKFRIPKGDRTNYSKVIFNNGLTTQTGTLYETAVIPDAEPNTSYKAGYIYFADGSSAKHYQQDSTSPFTKRGSGDDYIYIKVPSTITTWDDMHIVFYDGNDNRILQSDKGYVMEYSAKEDGNTYYRMAIPDNASKFSINNGRDKSGSYVHNPSDKYDIIRLSTVQEDSTATGYTKDRVVYSLGANDKLTLTSPTFPIRAYLYVRVAESDTAWNDMHVKFYKYDAVNNAYAQVPNTDSESNFAMTLYQTEGGYKYYRAAIPVGAEQFKLNDGNSTELSMKNISVNSWTPDRDVFTLSDNTLSEVNPDLRVRVADDDATTWGTVNVTFYKQDGTPFKDVDDNIIVYTMSNEGTAAGYKTYSKTIPDGAVKFDLNNGDSATLNNSEEHYTILVDIATPESAMYTISGVNGESGRVYSLIPSGTISTQDSRIDYTVRGQSERTDTLYIRDTANWKIALGDGKVRFYDENGTLIRGDGSKGNGTYTLIRSVNDSDSKKWYSIDIPTNAKTFTVSYHSGSSLVTTPVYEIYPYSTTDTGENRTATGDMYYQTVSGGTLALMTGTYTSTPAATYSYTARSNAEVNPDYLYLVCSNKDAWDEMKVTFKDADGENIENAVNVSPEYLNEIIYEPISPVDGVSSADPNAVGHWFRIPIPIGAKSFTAKVTDESTNPATLLRSTSGVIYDLKLTATAYEKDYTFGGMEYRLPDTGTVSKRLYPVFTEIEAPETDENAPKQADPSQISAYAGGVPDTLPTHSTSASTDTFVLYETDTGTITYQWGGIKLYYKNSNGWSTVYAHIWGDAGNLNVGEVDFPGNTMHSEGNNVWSIKVPLGAKHIIFSDGTDSNKTGDLDLPNDVENKSYIYQLPSSSGGTLEYIYFESIQDYDNAHYCWFYDGDTSSDATQNDGHGNYITPASNSIYLESDSKMRKPVDGLSGVNGRTVRITDIPSNAAYVKFGGYNDKDNNKGVITDYIAISDIEIGKGVAIDSDNITTGTPGSAGIKYFDVLDWDFEEYSANGGSGSATYQPEDRYGYIDNAAETDDANNFIKISTSLENPYIHFYANADGTGAVTAPDTDIRLNYSKVGDTDVTAPTSPYMIRLPKNAKSFKIKGTNSTTHATVTSAAQPLYNNGFHYAGATFTVADNATITVTPRTYTVNRSETMTDPLYPRSDGDYIFFTDTNGKLANNSGQVYAYFYGDMDGEFEFKYDENSTSIKWPGVVAQQNSNQPTTYTDNNGNTVYMFRVPQTRNGTYSYVMFNDGKTDNTRQITEAQPLEAGKNYVLDINTEHAKKYGTVTTTAYALSVEDKALSASANYGNSNKYIYIMNNGTYNMGLVTGKERTIFDEMHVVFYDMYNHVIGAESGYIPDRLGKDDTWEALTKDGSEVYRIVVPSNAKYFQITNGVNKGLTNDSDTHKNERYSEIAEIADNGLYRFLVSGDSGVSANADYLEGASAPTSEANLYTPKYLLKLVNPLENVIPETIIRDVKLATVVTDTDGKPKYIKWLKPKPVDGKEYNLNDPTTYQAGTVDTEYLKHTTADIYDPETQTGYQLKKVNVMKKGTYYWVETAAPSGYDVNTDKHLMFVEDDGSIYFYDENNNRVKVEGDNKLVIVNETSETKSEVILTKTAKEKVGTIDIGNALAGAQFKLLKVNADGTTDDTLHFTLVTADNTNKYTLGSGTHNQSGSWLTTGTDGKLHIFNLANGDYYLEEQAAPNGYSYLDSNTGTNKKIYFSVGENREVKEISAADEMEPAYIKLYEHINMKKDEWGNPTFVFKIKQTGYYAWSTAATPEWKYTTTDSGKEILVALTVDDNKTIKNVVKWFNPTGIKFDGDKIDNTTYGNWLVEGTTDLDDYQGIFDIDSKGRIRVEPGSYEITRVPVSRYEFVTNGKTEPYLNDTEPGNWTEYTVNGNKSEKLKIGEDNNGTMVGLLEPGKTIDVHYYDQVAYYDKFSQVDEKINKFYQLDSNHKNITVKGIRIADYSQKGTGENGDTDSTTGDMTIKVADLAICKIMSDGSEIPMTTEEKAAITAADIDITYTFAEKDSKKFGGSTADSIPAQFAYDSTNKQITVTSSSDFEKGVYTLKANYKGFEDEFDIVFSR